LHYPDRDPSPPNPPIRKVSGVFDAYLLRGCPVIMNLAVDAVFTYKILYQLVERALDCGGILEKSNQEIVIFSFDPEGMLRFMDRICAEYVVIKGVASVVSKGRSKVNIRFRKD
jgi:hypothetical protein